MKTHVGFITHILKTLVFTYTGQKYCGEYLKNAQQRLSRGRDLETKQLEINCALIISVK